MSKFSWLSVLNCCAWVQCHDTNFIVLLDNSISFELFFLEIECVWLNQELPKNSHVRGNKAVGSGGLAGGA